MNLTDKDIADLLDDVAETLAKSKKALKKDDVAPAPEEEAAPAPEAAPVAPEQAAPAPEQAPEAQAPVAPEAELQGEAQGEQPLTDEELAQVYSSMDEEELERHFNAIKGILMGAEGGEQAPEQAPEQAAPEAAAPVAPEMAAAPAPEASAAPAPEAKPEEEAFKSEKLVKENEELKKSVATLAGALEKFMKPVRKSVDSLTKSEALEPMAKSDVQVAIKALVKSPALSKAERSTINGFLFHGIDQELVEAIITKHSGRK